MLYGKLGVNFVSTSQLLYPEMKKKLRLVRARHNSGMISDNPNVSLVTLIAQSTLAVLLSRTIITRKVLTCLPILIWSSTLWRL